VQAQLLAQLLDREVAVCAEDPMLAGLDIAIRREGHVVLVRFERGRDGRPGMFQLDCGQFDAQPPSVAMVDPDTGQDLPIERWTPGVPHSIHPITGRPFVCIQGVAEYHSHPSHLDDSWDRYRTRYRLAQTIRRLLQKAGVIA
jgi:hypothetical protein